jgi:hypothetical protein
MVLKLKRSQGLLALFQPLQRLLSAGDRKRKNCLRPERVTLLKTRIFRDEGKIDVNSPSSGRPADAALEI